MKYVYVVTILGLVVSGIIYTGKEDIKAMKACQEKHSQDYCFTQIHN